MYRQYRSINPRESFVVAADTAAGGGDYCSVQFLSKTNLDLPLVYHEKTLATDMTNKLLPVLEKLSEQTGIKPVVAYERNNGGLFEMERLATLNRRNKFTVFMMPEYGSEDSDVSKKYGWDTNTATRPKMLSDLKEAVDKRLLTIYDKPTITELYSFVTVRTSNSWKAQAERGSHDDLVIALAIAWQLYQITPMDDGSSDDEWFVVQEENARIMREKGY